MEITDITEHKKQCCKCEDAPAKWGFTLGLGTWCMCHTCCEKWVAEIAEEFEDDLIVEMFANAQTVSDE